MLSDEKDFEDEVRRIARLLWSQAEFGGASIEDGKERDGIFETSEFVQIVECTVSRKKEKATEDFIKISKLIRQYRQKTPHKFTRGWFITLHEPTADQRGVFKNSNNQVIPISFSQFQSKLVDAKTYINFRKDYPFGSVRDPETGDNRNTTFEYIPLDIVDDSQNIFSIESIASSLVTGKRFVLLGDYGAGKSATIREIFKKTSSLFISGKISQFPVVLNLRDHLGQTNPVEALERHARNIGFPKPHELVRAWNAGLMILLLDGFDEVAIAGWAGKTKTLKDIRYRSMELIKKIIINTPTNCGLVVTGRAHFFDSPREMASALSINDNFKILNLNEFNDIQIASFLNKMGWKDPIPEWIPSRPLLLGYLASRGLLKQVINTKAESGPAAGWNNLLERICEREAEVDPGIDSDTVLRLISYLATIARYSADGLGPISPDQIYEAFIKICTYPPDDRGTILLQRLPGLGAPNQEDGSRIFIDQDFVDAAKGCYIYEIIENPFMQHLSSEGWQTSISPLAAEVAAHRCQEKKCVPGKTAAAIQRIQENQRSSTLLADLFLVLRYLGTHYDGKPIYIKEVLIPDLILELPVGDLNKFHFQDCIVGHLDLSFDVDNKSLPSFLRCYFGTVEGRTGISDMPQTEFVDCSYDSFENPAVTTNAILSLSLPIPTKVLLTILKKLYAQKGAARRESAFFRGLDARGQEIVPAALELLRKEGFIIKSRQGDQPLWICVKSSEHRNRALNILSAPNSIEDPLIQKSKNMFP
jgi:hypothetical protein